jgi:hypothetical protein
MSIIFLSFIYIERRGEGRGEGREKRREIWGTSEKHYIGGGVEKTISSV